MINYTEVFKKMPMAILYVKCEFLENGFLTMKVEAISDNLCSFLNMNRKEIINEDFFKILPDFNNDVKFTDMVKDCNNENLNYTKYVKKLMEFIRITIQKINETNFLLYLDRCIDTHLLEDIHNEDKIFFIKDKDNKYVYGSEMFKSFSQYENKDIYGLNDIDLYGEEMGGLYLKSSEKFIKEMKPYGRTICKLNNQIYFLHRNAIYSNNEVVGIIGIFENIMGKIEKINDGNIFTGIVNNIPDHIIFKDINGVYLECNDRFLKDLNIKREDIIGKANSSISELNEIHVSTIKSDLEVINEKKRKIYNEQMNINGKLLEFEIVKEPFFDSYGTLIGIIAIGRDVSHRTEIERLRLEFFANLSHELRTPLNLIFSSLQTLKSTENELLKKNEKINKYINIISQNSKRLLKLVNNLIDTTKIDCGFYEYKPKNENIVNFVENIAMSVAEFAKQNDITLVFDTDVEEKIMAFDLEKLERTMLNLLSNSIKYNNFPGRIEVLLNDCGDTFNITVRDTGIGIPSDKLNVVFEKFKQVENRLRKRSEGSGIGLSLVKELIKIQGGIIEVKSEVGVGSEFTVKLPVRLLENEESFDDSYYEDGNEGLVTRMNIEFSDIYI